MKPAHPEHCARADTRRPARRAAIIALAAGAILAGSLQAAAPWTQTLTQQALDSGFLTRLPPNVSTAFGLSKPQDGTDVRQLLTKQGHQVRTFNVTVANHADLVVLDLNAQTGASVAYLVSPAGELRKAVSYQGAGEVKPLGAADAKAGLGREKKYWSARARSAPAAAPATPATPSGTGVTPPPRGG